MLSLKNTSIRVKILSVFIPLCIIGLGATGFMADRYWATDKTYSEFIRRDNAMAIELARIDRSLTAAAYAAYQTLVYRAGDPSLRDAVKFYEENKKTLKERFASIKSTLPARAAELDSLQVRTEKVLTLTDEAMTYGSKGQQNGAKETLAEVDSQILRVSKAISTFADKYQREIVTKSEELNDETSRTIYRSLSALAVVFAGGVVVALLVSTKGITTPIKQLCNRMEALADGDTEGDIPGRNRGDEVGQMAAAVAVFRDNALDRVRLEREAETNSSLAERDRLEREAEKAKEDAAAQFAVEHLRIALGRLAEGDLTARIEIPFTGYLDALRSDFNVSAANLQDVLREVGQNARGVDAGAKDIRSAVDDLSHRTEQQAASVEQTAAALEQITSTVMDASRRADEAGRLVAQAREGAQQSGIVVGKAVTAMHEIERSSIEINNIIGVIDEIAFQTNLLALNAGVEAARAGETGKGFAVVAQEVRELAQRSAVAASEIKTLIRASGDQVRLGVGLVAETGDVLRSIATEVQEISRHVVAIVESAREQATGLQEINHALSAIDYGTQQNAAMVEESTAASHGLAAQAIALNALIARFKLGCDNTGNAVETKDGHSVAGDYAA